MIQSLNELVEEARRLGPARIAVVEGHDPDVLEALKRAEPMGLASGILVGDPAKIEAAARQVGYRVPPERVFAAVG